MKSTSKAARENKGDVVLARMLATPPAGKPKPKPKAKKAKTKKPAR